jgi:DMSO/TMAO reductase YedYZ molybdopterin-dependent catalytic subunit
MSRRGALALVGGGALLVAAMTAGQTVGGPLRGLAFLLPRGRTTATTDGGPNDFPVNKTFAASGVDPAATGAGWRLELLGGRPVRLDLAALTALPQHTATLPIACVEGWSTVQDWTGVRLRDLAALAGVPAPVSAVVRSLEEGAFDRAMLTAGQVLHPDALLALGVNGAPLDLDHGYPARVIVPALPGVHNTKWVRSIEFRSA